MRRLTDYALRVVMDPTCFIVSVTTACGGIILAVCGIPQFGLLVFCSALATASASSAAVGVRDRMEREARASAGAALAHVWAAQESIDRIGPGADDVIGRRTCATNMLDIATVHLREIMRGSHHADH